jgi:hypothetical protein
MADREFAVAHGTQLPAELPLGDGDAELFKYSLYEIDQPLAHHAMDRWDWTALDHSINRLALGVIELGGLSRCLAVQQPVGPASVEPQDPIPDDLETNTTDLRRLGASCTVIDRGKRQQSPGLRPVFGLLRQPPQLRSVEIFPKQYRYGEPPSFATYESEPR